MKILETKDGREALLWAIRISQMGEVTLASGHRSGKTLKREAMALVHDPAKLAELIASEARRCGLRAMVADGNIQGAEDWAFYVVQLLGPDDHVRLIRDHYTLKGWDAPMARAILAALLQLPDGAKEAAEKVLRGESNR